MKHNENTIINVYPKYAPFGERKADASSKAERIIYLI